MQHARTQEGEQDVILRCINEEILASMSRVPGKFLDGLALKLLQVQVEPDKNGFGIDLTDSNIVASLVEGGAAANSDLKKGDILVGVDGCNLGTKKLVQVMQRGHSSYCFSVVRPAERGATDTLETEADKQSGSAEAASVAKTVRAQRSPKRLGQPNLTGNVRCPAQVPNADAIVADVASEESSAPKVASTSHANDELKNSLNKSLSQLQEQDKYLSDNRLIAPRILRLEPTNGTGVTCEWMPVPVDAVVSHYQLEWKLMTDSKWTHTEASSKLETTLVTKGSLRPNGCYQFRVRACDPSGAWGPFTEARPPNGVRPDGIEVHTVARSEVGALSTISEEQSGVSVAASVNLSTLQQVLSDQRQAMEDQYRLEQSKLEAAHQEQLRLKEIEGEEWRNKFLDASGTRMQAVLDAKEQVRSEAEEKLREDVEAASRAKLDALEAVRRAREAEDIAATCQAEVDKYKERYETVHRDVRAELEAEARTSVELVMRKAAQEIKDKVRIAEMQADARVERAVAETKRTCEAKAEAELRKVVHALEEKHQQVLAAVQTQAGAGLANRLARLQEKHDAHVQQSVKEALAAERAEAEKRTAAAVLAAKGEAKAETEARLGETQAKMERHVVAVASRVDSKVADELKTEVEKALYEERKRAAQQQREAVAMAVAKAEQGFRVKFEQMSEGVAHRIREAVAKREREILDEDGKVREASETQELREQLHTYRMAASEAARQWGSGNDDFEEAALAKTSTAMVLAQQGAEVAGRRHVMLEDDEFDGVASTVDGPEERNSAEDKEEGGDGQSEAERRRERRRKKRGEEEDGKKGKGSSRKGAKQAEAAAEGGLAVPSEVLPSGVTERADVRQLRERHELEVASLRSKHEAEELAMMDEDATGTGEGRRAAEMEKLRDRQMAEAIALGLSIQANDAEAKARIEAEAAAKAQQQEKRKSEVHAEAQADALARGAALMAQEEETPGFTALLGETRRAAGRVEGMHAAQQRGVQMAEEEDLTAAVQSVRQLEAQLEGMVRPQSELQQCLELEKREHRRTTAKLRQLLDRKDKGGGDEGGGALSSGENQAMQDALQLMRLYEKQVHAMQAMLHDVGDSEMDGEVRELHRQLANLQAQQGASKLESLLRLGPKAGTKDAKEATSLLEQAGAAARQCEEGVERVHAEAKRRRMERLQEAKRALHELRRSPDRPDDKLAIPVAPIAAAEDGFSIAVDWVAPASNAADHYHLQWRERIVGGRGEDAYTEWASSSASEQIGVPCCTKGSLRTHVAYQFRVRAFSRVSERWGPWSSPTEPTKPSILLQSMPSRPELRPLEGLVIEAEWSPPLVGNKAKVLQYEVQWCVCGSKLEWSAEQQARTSDTVFTSGTLRQGKSIYYTFRIRALIKTYASDEWTEWSPPAAPTRTFRDLPPNAAEPNGRGHGAGETTESMIEEQLARDAEDCPTEVRSAVRAEVRQLRDQHAADRQAHGVKQITQRGDADDQSSVQGSVLSTWD